ncbi:MAG: hypothetical protein GY720_10035 [bacterium]|nr:hypothetical protein [bacterium]
MNTKKNYTTPKVQTVPSTEILEAIGPASAYSGAVKDDASSGSSGCQTTVSMGANYCG